jgi:dTDP-glucose 4,6-dehydratase
MDASKLRTELGWEPCISFQTGMDATVLWYLEHEEWWQRIKSGEYMTYYEQWYGDR